MQNKKYEYTFSIRVGFEPCKNCVVWPDYSLSGGIEPETLKGTLEKIKEYIEKETKIISELKDNLQKLQGKRGEENENSNESASKTNEDKAVEIKIKGKFVAKFIETKFKEKDKLFVKLSKSSQQKFITLVSGLLEKLNDYKIEIEDELQKPNPNQARVREIIRKLLTSPDMTFNENRLISTTSLLDEIYENIEVSDSNAWQNYASTGEYRDFKIFLEEQLNILSKRKEVLKASLNRATINKSYTPEELRVKIKKIQQKMKVSLSDFLNEKELFELNKYIREITNVFEECKDKAFDPTNEILQSASEKLRKLYKNCIKKKFDKALENVFKEKGALNYDDVITSPEVQKSLQFIFNQNDEKFKERFTVYLQAKQKYFEIKKENKEEKEQASKDAGEKFTVTLQRYASKFIKIKNKVAREYGNLRAQAKSLDNARFFLSHLALLAFEKGKEFDSEYTQVLFIPKILVKNKALNKAIESVQQNPTHTIYELHSLTLSALKNKLIAKNVSELKPFLNTEKYPEFVAVYAMKAFLCKFFIDRRLCPIQIKLDDETFSAIMKALRKVKLANSHISDELRNKIKEEIIIPRHKSIEEFRKALEEKFYYLESKRVNLDALLSKLADELSKLNIKKEWKQKENNIFVGKVKFGQIRNRRYIKEFATLLDDIKNHRINHIRLNPEITLFFSEKEPENARHEKSRHNKNRFIVQFNYAKNKPGKLLDAKFSDDEGLKQAYGKFNKDLELKIQEAKNNNKYTRIGIDVGTSDFVSVVFFDNWENNRDIKKEGFPFKKVKVYKIKNEAFTAKAYIKTKKEPVYLWQNPSYFLHEDESKRAFKDVNLKERVNPEEYIEEKTLYSFDTSSAKVINNKVIINADVGNYLKLLLIPVVKDMLQNNKTIDDISNIQISKKSINIQTRGESFQANGLAAEVSEISVGLYNQSSKKGILRDVIEKIFKQLECMENNIDKKVEFLEILEKRIKKVIASNIVTSLTQLAITDQAIPEFFIESEPEAFLTDHESKRLGKKKQQSISREFPVALLRKLQKYELVPPKINRQFMLRELEHSNNLIKKMQLGIVHFIPASNTSRLCPVCMHKKDKKSVCSNCNFSEPNQDNSYGITSPDFQAAAVLANPSVVEALKRVNTN